MPLYSNKRIFKRITKKDDLRLGHLCCQNNLQKNLQKNYKAGRHRHMQQLTCEYANVIITECIFLTEKEIKKERKKAKDRQRQRKTENDKGTQGKKAGKKGRR